MAATREEILAYADAHPEETTANIGRRFGVKPNTITTWKRRRREQGTTPRGKVTLDELGPLARETLPTFLGNALRHLASPDAVSDGKNTAALARAMTSIVAMCPDLIKLPGTLTHDPDETSQDREARLQRLRDAFDLEQIERLEEKYEAGSRVRA